MVYIMLSARAAATEILKTNCCHKSVHPEQEEEDDGDGGFKRWHGHLS